MFNFIIIKASFKYLNQIWVIHSEANCSLLLSIALKLLFLTSETLSLSQSFGLILCRHFSGGEGWVLPSRPSGVAVLFPLLCWASVGPSGLQPTLPPWAHLWGGSLWWLYLCRTLCTSACSCGSPRLEFHAGGSLWLWWALPCGGCLGLFFRALPHSRGLCLYDLITSQRPSLLIPSHYLFFLF